MNKEEREPKFPICTQCSIIIVTCNSRFYLSHCLNPIVNIKTLEIIVVDNASTDDSLSCIENFSPRVKVIALKENLGFGSACNIGAKEASSNLLLFLNPDAVASPDSIELLCKFLLDHPKVGVVGGRLIHPLGYPLQSIGDRPSLFRLMIDKPLSLLATYITPKGFWHKLLGAFSSKFRLPKNPVNVSWVSGAALCCRRTMWVEIGGFDERFFLYYEDVDLCVRASATGWEVWHIPDAIVEHQSGASFGGDVNKQKAIYYANQHYFFQKHFGPWAARILWIFQSVYSRFALYRQF